MKPCARSATALAAVLSLACSDRATSAQPSDVEHGGFGGAKGEAGAGAGGTANSEPSDLLSETGLYADLAQSETLAPDVLVYRPRFELWSDGAEKRRFLWLPPGETIDTADADYWVYPVGTRAWKEFSQDGVRLETRLLQKMSNEDWFMVAYSWNEEATEATAVPRGAENVAGTEHDIPSRVMCGECHDNMPDKLLGIGAVQLSHSLGGLDLDALTADLRLSEPVERVELPGDTVAQGALGYLHANCGNCHNRHSGEFPMVHLELHLELAGLASVETTTTYLTTIGVPFEGIRPTPETSDIRIVPGRPEESALYQRMSVRELLVQMPPIATEVVDPDGLSSIALWIGALE